MNVATDISVYAAIAPPVSQPSGKQAGLGKDDNLGSFGGILGDQILQQLDLSPVPDKQVPNGNAQPEKTEAGRMSAFPAFSQSAAEAVQESSVIGRNIDTVDGVIAAPPALSQKQFNSGALSTALNLPAALPGQSALAHVGLAATFCPLEKGAVRFGVHQVSDGDSTSPKDGKEHASVSQSASAAPQAGAIRHVSEVSPEAALLPMQNAGTSLSLPVAQAIGTSQGAVFSKGATSTLAKMQVSDHAPGAGSAALPAQSSLMPSSTAGLDKTLTSPGPEEMQAAGQAPTLGQTHKPLNMQATDGTGPAESLRGTSLTAAVYSNDSQLRSFTDDPEPNSGSSLTIPSAGGRFSSVSDSTVPTGLAAVSQALPGPGHAISSHDPRKVLLTETSMPGGPSEKISLGGGDSILGGRQAGADAVPISGSVGAHDGVHANGSTAGSSSSIDKNFFAQMDSPIAGGPRAANLTSGATLLHAGSREIDVGVHDPVYGWVEVKAQMVSGQVAASLSATTATASHALEAQLPAISSYLAQREVSVNTLDVTAHSGGGQGSQREQGSDGGREQPSPSQPSVIDSRAAPPSSSVRDDLQPWISTAGRSSGIRVVA